ncbi:MAG: VWA domain-containing protein [Acidobacteria bacterium]|nr:VWA domain-containing protein [Acidobacteriota bacterium]
MAASKVSAWLCAGILLQTPGMAQQAPLPPEAPIPTLKVEVSVVNVLCTVRDRRGRLISNLDKSAFEIREDGQPQKILYFSQETKLPLTLGLLVDSSVSQERIIAQEQQAAAAFLAQVLGQQDAAFLISFDVNIELLQDVTGSLDFLRRALGDIQIEGGAPSSGPFPTVRTGGTRLYDAVYLGATEVLQNEAGRKAVILISDGQDHGSKVSREEAIETAQRNDVMVYAILFVDRSFYGQGGVGYFGESILKEMAEETGGRLFRAENNQQLTEAFQQISDELRSQYSLGYSPTNSAPDGSYRRIEVKIQKGGHRVQARKGYYASAGG